MTADSLRGLVSVHCTVGVVVCSGCFLYVSVLSYAVWELA